MANGINRDFFFTYVRQHLFGGLLQQRQVDGLNAILDYWEATNAENDDRWLAYALATTHHETDRTFRGIEEYGKGHGKPYGEIDPETGKAYYGRGFVQLTWRKNYQRMGNLLNIDLVHYPEKALELGTATKILFVGMTRGVFTGKELSDYFNDTADDWVDARRIINGTDKANLIAGYGHDYYAAVSYTTRDAAPQLAAANAPPQ